MKFNSFLWETYKNSENSKNLIDLFDSKDIFTDDKKISSLFELINSFKIIKLDKDDFIYFTKTVNFVLNDIKSVLAPNIDSDEKAHLLLQDIWHLIREIDKDKEKPPHYFSVDDMELISSVLFLIEPNYFFPYYFIREFYYIKNIFNEFGIFLPLVPKKTDMDARFLFYWELCNSLNKFRSKYNISGIELPVFIYGFAINVVERYKVTNILPEPTRAFFVGGGKKGDGVDYQGDFKYLDEANQESVNNWQGNPETQVGDIIVMYCLHPRSYIHSIWRAVTPGSIDPFFYFYRNVYIGNPTFVNKITLEELKSDKILSDMPLVRSNMQGINGKIIPKIYYDRILELLKLKGTDIKELPQLSNININIPKLQSEKDVEKELLEPLLIKLGYTKKDWKKQVTVRMGRGEKVYPDYVIFPNEEKNNESGYWVWEAKYSIVSNKQLEKDFGQAKSYALRLRCSGLGLISKEGIWLSDNSFNFSSLKYYSWKQIQEIDFFAEIKNIAGCK